jgi:transposase-like protein
MIQKTITYTCHDCGSTDIVKNGTNKCGSAQYRCNNCGSHRVLEPKRSHTKREKETILKAYQERASMRGLERIFGISRQTVADWIRKIVADLPDFKDTLEPVQPEDVLELDEVWSFVLKKEKNAGCGRRFVVARAKSSPLSLGIVAREPVDAYGIRFQNPTAPVAHSVISGKPTRRCFPRIRTSLWVKRRDRLLIWSVGITLCANDWRASCVRRFPFPHPMLFTIWSPNGLSSPITWHSHHLPSNHYPPQVASSDSR